ncbi:hypothetical protein CHLNCDRAFT_136852 [Chlorella variabilis]|uniref:Protein kinase domain-containing protein n=1 Tax=Chlorella variabilis TaxID=554065 RepID=E1ZL72_CHLVA|nr:hypothetical protein CHLNCDRAFT_136852 [Chlorella variabilis]EFN53510.1 hypothetical protein CHLNCDRAFT_136852 [Chlorella variabilis]|eukprot:XP_005845612.1 hypothetical protein CHLNCDRAFT_136852 [Chlorella variabilis]
MSDYPEAGRKLRTDATVEEVYALGALLGQGGGWPYAAKLSCPPSKVRLATDLLLGQQWACKIMRLPRGDKLVEDPMAGRAAIMKEVDVLLDLDHPNVVGMREYFVQHHRVYLIMELMRGGELLDALQAQGHYSEGDARTIFRQLIEALQYLHSKGVVHRDVKLKNLLLVAPGDITRIKLADFGFARKVSKRWSNTLRTVCGTPGYIAPEIVRNATQPTFGAPSRKMFYGPPCDLCDKSEPRLLRSIMAGKYSLDDPVWEEVSGEAKDLVSKLLVVDPASRLTCQQVLEHPWMTQPTPDTPLQRAHSRLQGSGSFTWRLRRRKSLEERISAALSASRDVSVRSGAANTSVRSELAGRAPGSSAAASPPGSPPAVPPSAAAAAPASPAARCE